LKESERQAGQGQKESCKNPATIARLAAFIPRYFPRNLLISPAKQNGCLQSHPRRPTYRVRGIGAERQRPLALQVSIHPNSTAGIGRRSPIKARRPMPAANGLLLLPSPFGIAENSIKIAIHAMFLPQHYAIVITLFRRKDKQAWITYHSRVRCQSERKRMFL